MSENNHATVHRASENGDATERRDLEQLQTERDHLVNTVEDLQAECERLAALAEASQASELDALRELVRYQRGELKQWRKSVRTARSDN